MPPAEQPDRPHLVVPAARPGFGTLRTIDGRDIEYDEAIA
jgi:hypothetical protein